MGKKRQNRVIPQDEIIKADRPKVEGIQSIYWTEDQRKFLAVLIKEYFPEMYKDNQRHMSFTEFIVTGFTADNQAIRVSLVEFILNINVLDRLFKNALSHRLRMLKMLDEGVNPIEYIRANL